MMEKNIFSIGKTLNRFIAAQRTSIEQVRNEGRYSARRSSIKHRCKSSHRSSLPHRRHHDLRQRSESPIPLAASQSNIVGGSEIDFVYHNPPPPIVNFEHVNAD